MKQQIKRQFKYTSLAVSALFLAMTTVGFANKAQPLDSSDTQAHQLSPNWWVDAGYSNSGFTYRSNSGNNLNHYNGHNNIYNITLWRQFQHDIMLGLDYSRVLTGVASRLRINNTNSYGQTNIRGNYFSLRLRKFWQHKFYLEGYAQYGYESSQLFQTNAGASSTTSGHAKYGGNLFSTGASTGIIYHFHNKFVLGGDITLFYLKSNYDSYRMRFGDGTTYNEPSYGISDLNLAENVTLQYHLSQHFKPYAQVGLLQVLYRGRSREIANGLRPLTSQIPGLELSKGGYNAGGGLEFSWKKLSLRAGYSYFRRGKAFKQNYIYTHLSYAF